MKQGGRTLLTAAAVLAAAFATACTDAATRIAYDLEAGAKSLRASPAQSATVDHAPQRRPEGCPGGYKVQLSKESALVVWCEDSPDGPSVGSHTTTYHLNWVSVPETLSIYKPAGEHLVLQLEKRGDSIAVVSVR
ncbi:MAG TPA: hypothetical protein VMR50_13000 [Myxococcota bacterium]|nr:hypothetical protein [Myxococcota bacterium]